MDGRKDHKIKTEAGSNISNIDSPNHYSPEHQSCGSRGDWCSCCSGAWGIGVSTYTHYTTTNRILDKYELQTSYI